MSRPLRIVLVGWLLTCSVGTLANDATRAGQLAAELRCVVCQNQSIAESNADLAVELRRQIGVQIAAGRTDAQIRAFMVDRYGEFVLYRPPFRPATVLLWFGPVLLLIAGFALLRQAIARGADAPDSVRLSDHDRKLAARLLQEERRSSRQ